MPDFLEKDMSKHKGLNYNVELKAGHVAQLVECLLPSMHGALGSVPSIRQN